MDAVISSAEPTEDLDAITVGLVCVRNLQVTFYVNSSLVYVKEIFFALFVYCSLCVLIVLSIFLRISRALLEFTLMPDSSFFAAQRGLLHGSMELRTQDLVSVQGNRL